MRNKQCYTLPKIIVFFVVLLILAPAHALRCGNQLVEAGDGQVKVLKLCGEPALKNKVQQQIKLNNNNTATINEVEQWTYNFGPTDFLYILSFSSGKLIKIETDGYGF